MNAIKDAGMKEKPIENMNEAIIPSGVPFKLITFFVNLIGWLDNLMFTSLKGKNIYCQ